MNSQTVTFNGKAINLSEIARETGYSVSHISKIFSGKREPSMKALRIISAHMSMSIDEFVSLIA